MKEFLEKYGKGKADLAAAELKRATEELEFAQQQHAMKLLRDLPPATQADLDQDAQAAYVELCGVAGLSIAKRVRHLIDASIAGSLLRSPTRPADVPGVSRVCPDGVPTSVGTGLDPDESGRNSQPATSDPGESGCVSLKDYLTPPGAGSPMGGHEAQGRALSAEVALLKHMLGKIVGTYYEGCSGTLARVIVEAERYA